MTYDSDRVKHAVLAQPGVTAVHCIKWDGDRVIIDVVLDGVDVIDVLNAVRDALPDLTGIEVYTVTP